MEGLWRGYFSQCVSVLSELAIQCLSCFFISQNSKRVTSGCGDHGFGNQLCPESYYLQSNYSMWKACSYEYSSVLLAMPSIQGCFLFWHIVLRNGNFRTHSADPVPSSGSQYHQAEHSIDSYLKSCHSGFKVYALTYMCTAGLSMECLGGSWVSFLCCICHVQGGEALKSFFLTVPGSDTHDGLEEWKVWIFNLREVRKAYSFSLGQAVFWNHLEAGRGMDLSKEWCTDSLAPVLLSR